MADEKPTEIDLKDPAVLAAIAAAVDEQTAGLKTNRDEILAEKKIQRETLDAVQLQLKAFDGLDAPAVRELMDRIANDEDAKLISEGKYEDVLTKRTDALRKDYEAQIKKLSQNAETLTGSLAASQGKIKELVVDAALRQAATDQTCIPSAIPDIILRGRSVFDLDDDHAIVAKGPDGVTLFGKDGKTALPPAEWLEGTKESCPHWWPPSSGGGAGGGTGAGGKAPGDASNMTPRQKLGSGFSQD